MAQKKNKLDRICVAIVILTILVTVLFMNGEALGITKIVDEDAQQNSDTIHFTSKDQDGSWDISSATVITLEGDSASIQGYGAYSYNGKVVISEAGRYVLTGTLSNGYVSVDAHKSSKVWLLLDGVDINCSDNACIRVDQADKVFLTLAEGSQNSLTSGFPYSDAALADGTDGGIFAHDDLTINGSGSLSVNAAYKHGIAANDDLVITGGTISVTAAGDGFHANDSIRIKDATITVNAGDEGIVTDSETEGSYMYIESGTIIACGASHSDEIFDASSMQASILYNFSTAAPAGTVLTLKDAEGNVLLSGEVPCAFSSVLISCPQMKVGESYRICIGDREEEIVLEDISTVCG